MQSGDGGSQQIVGKVLAGAPDNFAKAASLWGLRLFAEHRKAPQLLQVAKDEAYIAYRNWKELSPGWLSMAMLARDRIEQDHPNDPDWKLRHYDMITDHVSGSGADFVPMFDDDYYRTLYRFGSAAIAAPGATDHQIENALSVLSDLLEKKIEGKPVPITTNSLRYQLATVLVISAKRQRAPSRLDRAKDLVSFIDAHPDDSTELTATLMDQLRSQLKAECARLRCSFS